MTLQTRPETAPEAAPASAPLVAERDTIADLLAAAIRAIGVEHVFTLMGAGNLRLVHHLAADYGVQVHHLRHENTAIGAADGFARTTGEVGWCTVTQGPGFTNIFTALITAAKGSTPLVLVTADSSNLDERIAPFAGGIQGLDPEIMLKPLGIPVIRATFDSAADDLVDAYLLARDERRPVVFVLPAGLDTKHAPSMSVDAAAARAAVRVAPAVHPLDAAAVGAAADELLAARHPVILAGRGALDARSLLVELADLVGAHLSTTIKATGLFHGVPSDLGIFGGFSHETAAETIHASDCILAVGAAVNLFQTRKSVLVENARLLQIDTDPAAFGQYEPVTVGIVGDAVQAVSALIDAVRLRLTERGESGRTAPDAPQPAPFADVSTIGSLDPRVVCERLDVLLSADRTVVIDNGHFGSFPIMHLTHTDPAGFVWLSDFGAIGCAIGAGIAAAVAHPDSQAVLFIGDCGFYMTMGDFETAVREKIPLLVVCMNDGAAGSELQHMKDWSVPTAEAIFGVADIAAAAAGMGSQAALISSLDELEPALAGWQRERGPLFLDVHISRAVRSPIYDHV
ncbi:MAG: Acetolactate synthase isozyme 3 large subunit [Subtercola sp.]|nr:Acetolactate synthase isozyme 3 large subunit [Subtercola sp.]